MPTQRSKKIENANAGKRSATGRMEKPKKPTSRTAPKKQPTGRVKATTSKKDRTAPIARKPQGSKPTQRSKQPTQKISNKVGATGSQRQVTGSQRQVTGSQRQVTGAQRQVTGSQHQVTGSQRQVAGSATGRSKPVTKRVVAMPQPAANAPKAGQKRLPGKQVAPFGAKGNKTTNPIFKSKIFIGFAAVVIAFVAFGAFDLISTFGKVHSGVSVQGVDVGGLSKEQASAKITDALTPTLEASEAVMYENEQIAYADGATLQGDGGIEKAVADENKLGNDLDGNGKADKWSIRHNTIGAYIDGDALAEKAFAVGRNGSFFTERLSSWLGGTSIPAEISFKNEQYESFTNEVNKEIGKKISDSKAKIENGVATLKEGHDGYQLNDDKFKAAMRSAVFDNAKSFVAPMDTISRHITPETASRVVDQINHAIGYNVEIKYDGESWIMDSYDLGNVVSQEVLEPGKSLSIGWGTQKVVDSSEMGDSTAYDTSAGTDAASNWALQAYVDQEKFDEFLVGVLGDRAQGGAKDAEFYIKKNKVKIKASKNGKGPNRQQAEVDLQNMLFGSWQGEREIEIKNATIQPSLTTEQAKSMGIKDRLARWEIPLSGTTARIHNIRLLCNAINGSLVAPGKSWSFNGTVGERSEEKGYKKASVIVGGEHVDELGGGVCQVATCIYNCACYSGLGINNRVNHDFYISAYDDRGFADATVSWDVPDLEWVNDMENYILVTADADGDDVVVQFWGTDEGRKITCDRGKWKKGDTAKTVRRTTDELPAGETRVVQTAVDGRSIKIHYVAKDKNGKVLHDIMFNSVYSAQDEIIETGTQTESSDDTDTSSESDGSSEASSDTGTEETSETSEEEA